MGESDGNLGFWIPTFHLPLICSTPGASCDFEEKRCDDSIHPEGHCCPICGALIHLKIPRENFLLSVYEKLLVRHLLSPEAGNVVRGYIGVSKREKDFVHVQALFTDTYDASRSIILAKKLERELREDMSHANAFSVAGLTANYSGLSYSSSASAFGEAIGVVLILAMLICCTYYLYRKFTRVVREEAFTFARFDNAAEGRGSVQVVVETEIKSDTSSISTQSSAVQSPSGQFESTEDSTTSMDYVRRQFRRLSTLSRNFINPLFGNSAAENFSPTVNLASLVREEPTANNPFYTVASEKGITDNELSKNQVSKALGLDRPIVEQSTSAKVEDLSVSPVLPPIAEEKYEEVSLEDETSKEGGSSSSKRSEKSPVASARKGKKKEGKSILKRVISGRKVPEDSENLMEKEESQA